MINNMDEKASLYINESQSSENSFVRIELKGSTENPLGLGAKVSLETAERMQTQEMTLSRGYQSSSEPILHFGLGKAKEITRITPSNI